MKIIDINELEQPYTRAWFSKLSRINSGQARLAKQNFNHPDSCIVCGVKNATLCISLTSGAPDLALFLCPDCTLIQSEMYHAVYLPFAKLIRPRLQHDWS